MSLKQLFDNKLNSLFNTFISPVSHPSVIIITMCTTSQNSLSHFKLNFFTDSPILVLPDNL